MPTASTGSHRTLLTSTVTSLSFCLLAVSILVNDRVQVAGELKRYWLFLTAPWCLGVAYQVVAGRRPPRYLFVAAALLLFSSSWFYDGYLLLREGSYTTRWWSNLMLSPIIYLTAGCLWNLEARGRFGVRLGFVRRDWPNRPSDGRFLPIIFASIPLLLIAAFVLVAVVQWRIPSMGR